MTYFLELTRYTPGSENMTVLVRSTSIQTVLDDGGACNLGTVENPFGLRVTESFSTVREMLTRNLPPDPISDKIPGMIIIEPEEVKVHE